jgi:hypothetical protein
VIQGGIVGLLVAVIYTLVTGKLVLNKRRVVYGTPARAAALLSLVPLMLVVILCKVQGGITVMPGGILWFLGGLIASVALGCAVAWPFGEPPRQ